MKTIIHAMVDANGKVQAVPAGKAADHILAYLAPVLKSTTEESAPIYEEAALLDALRENSWDLRCFDRPTGGGDADIGWRIVGHWQAEPHERTIAEVYADDPRAAILAALSASTGARAC